jgi:hypothetical protein
VASEFGEQRDASQNVLMNQIDTFIDDVFVKPAIAMNMPTYEGKLEKKTLGFGSDDEDIVRQVFQLMGQEDGFARFGIDVVASPSREGSPCSTTPPSRSFSRMLRLRPRRLLRRRLLRPRAGGLWSPRRASIARPVRLR